MSDRPSPPSSSPPSSSSDRVLDIMLQAAITAVVVVGVSKLMNKDKKEEDKVNSKSKVESRRSAPLPPPSVNSLAKVSSHTSLREDAITVEREYKIERNGNFTADSSLCRSRTWNKHPTWHIPSLEREKIHVFSGIDNILNTLNYYSVSAHRGFLPETDPLQRLPHEQYYLWEDMADDLPKLLSARLGQVREPLSRLPVIPTDLLTTEGELRRAHLLLCLFAHAFVWGGTPVMEFIPQGISIPLWEVSCRLDVPPVLMNMDITLYNWRRLDPQAGLNMMNLSTLNSFFSGRDESWFYLITVEIEAIGAEAIVPLMQINADIRRGLKTEGSSDSGKYNNNVRNVTLLENMKVKFDAIADCIDRMTHSLASTREGCHPFIFYHRVRPFLAGWKSNPALPNGLKYEGVYVRWEDRPSYEEMLCGDSSPPPLPSSRPRNGSKSRRGEAAAGRAWSPALMKEVDLGEGDGLDECPAQYFSGGSAAQTALFPFLDLMLGVDHKEHDQSKRSGGFIKSMRQYMPRSHRLFLGHMDKEACIRTFMCSCEEVLRDEQQPGSEQHREQQDGGSGRSSPSGSSGSGSPSGSSTPPWVWKGNGASLTAIQTDRSGGEGALSDLLVASLTALCASYNRCLASLSKLRSGHMSLVHDYIIAQQKLGAAPSGTSSISSSTGSGSSTLSIEKNAGGKGTGGTDLMHFLKPMRDKCNTTKVLKTHGGGAAASSSS